MASQQRLHVLVQHEAAPHHPAVAEHEREQPDDPLGSRLVGKDRAEMGEIHLRLTAGRRLETDLEAGGRSRTHLAQEVLQHRVSAGISQLADLAMQPTAGQFRNRGDALAQVALEWRQLGRSRRPRSINRRLDAACDVFRDGAPVQAGPPGDRRDGHPLLVQLQYHDQLRQPDHPSPPPTHRRRGGLSPDAVPTGPTQAALGVPPAYRDVGFSVARSGENSPGDDNRAGVAGEEGTTATWMVMMRPPVWTWQVSLLCSACDWRWFGDDRDTHWRESQLARLWRRCGTKRSPTALRPRRSFQAASPSLQCRRSGQARP